ncbi:MAG: hypothetical protein WBA48_17365 [Xanthobacteraceae bacterium]
MLITAPFWIAATTIETCNRLATLMFWGMLTRPAELQPKPVEVKEQNQLQAEALPLAA